MLNERSRRRETEAPIIGLIGGIASGKSYVAKTLEDLGCVCIHADQVGHELLDNPMIQVQLRQAFGNDIFRSDGSVDRPKLGALVFGQQSGSQQLLEQLNQIMHPAIRSAIIRQIECLLRHEPVPKAIVLDAALLLEAGWDRSCDWIFFVDTPDSVRLERALARGWTIEQWQAREAAQMPMDQKRRSATHFISGVMELGELRRKLLGLLCELVD